MFKVKFEDGFIFEDSGVTHELETADDVANLIAEKTHLWMFASHIRDVWSKTKPGDIEEYKDVGVTIERI